MNSYIPQTDFTAAGFANAVNNDHLPWNALHWSDSMIEQYFNMMNAEQANQHEIEMWRLNNDYNTPEKQMQRMVAAGINPAAAYQQISSGNASSAPGTHKTDSVRWHDTQDKLARINTIISGIRDIMSTVGSGISAAQGVQDIALRHQNNWFDKMRHDVALNNDVWFGSEQQIRDRYPGMQPVRIGDNLFMSSRDAFLFPEFSEISKNVRGWSGYDIQEAARQDQHSLVERRNRIDELMQKIFKGFDDGASTEDMLKWFLQLIAYGFQQRVGGGF